MHIQLFFQMMEHVSLSISVNALLNYSHNFDKIVCLHVFTLLLLLLYNDFYDIEIILS